MRFQGKVALVTGATKEAGATLARRFAGEGAAVACLGRSESLGKAAARSIEDAGGRAIFVPVQLAEEASVKAAIAEVVRAFGRLDVVINHAAAQDLLKGVGESPVAEEPSELFDQILKVNLYAPFWICKYAIPEMLKNGGGVVLSVSSINAARAADGMPAYVASKSGLEGLMRQVANDYGRQGIRANSIALGSMRHAETEVVFGNPEQATVRNHARMLDFPSVPDDLADLLLFLASDQARFITGSVIPLDGGALSRYPAPHFGANVSSS